MEIFRDELGFVLNNTDIPKDKTFEFIKGLSTSIYIMKGVTLNYDDTKTLARFLWEIFSGFSFITGYREKDIIQDMIDEI